MGGLTFQSLVDFSWAVTEFESLDSVVNKVAWGYQKPKKMDSQCHCGDEVFKVTMESTLIFFPQSYWVMI